METPPQTSEQHLKGKLITSLLFFLWTAILLTVFFIYQKPIAIPQVIQGLGSLFWTILLAFLITMLAAGLGQKWLGALTSNPQERFLLGSGLGLGLFGLAGFGLAVMGWAKPAVLLSILAFLLFWQVMRGIFSVAWSDLRTTFSALKASSRTMPFWMPLAAGIAFFLTFIQSLAPAADGFDALLYHLTIPAWWLRDGGLRLVELLPYWYPNLIEGIFLWPMGLGSDTAPQLLHLIFGVLTILLAWHWTSSLWGEQAGWWTLILILTMPSILWLATWAYTDLALTFFAMSVLYFLWKWADSANSHWLWYAASSAGFAMGVKYTSFIIPVFAEIVILARLLKKETEKRQVLFAALQFGLIALVLACPWYLRNWIWMGNPVYPFVFGGPFWDSYRTQFNAGTGIGWDIKELLLLPLSVTLASHETYSYVDARIGPFYLILAPILIWIAQTARFEMPNRSQRAFSIIGLYVLTSFAYWTFGVVNTAVLWQARYLFPGLIPLTIPLALAVQKLYTLDNKTLRVSFIFSALVGLFIFITLLDFGLLIFNRNPLMVAIGAESRASYLQRLQAGYAEELALVAQAPADAVIYAICEPRSYGMTRKVIPDANLDHWSHNLYLFKNAETILAAWQNNGYTHLLLQRCELENPAELSRLEKLLKVIQASEDEKYILFSIPPKNAEN